MRRCAKARAACLCFFFSDFKRQEEQQQVQAQTDETQEEGSTDGTPRRRFIIKGFTVFNTAQIDNLPEQFKPAAMPEPSADFEPIEAAEDLVQGYLRCKGPQVEHGLHNPAYSPGLDLVKMPQPGFFENPTEYYAAKFHELGHSTGHQSRLNRPSLYDGAFGSEPYAREELVAELCAAYCCAWTRIDSRPLDTNAAAYLANWASRIKNDPQLFLFAAGQAEKAFNLITGQNQAEAKANVQA